MILDKYLSDTGQYISENVNLAAGTLAWGLRAKKRAQEFPGFINATIGSATEENGDLLVFPTLVEEIKKLTPNQLFAYANMRGEVDFVHAWNKDTLETYGEELNNRNIEICWVDYAMTDVEFSIERLHENYSEPEPDVYNDEALLEDKIKPILEGRNIFDDIDEDI